MGGGLTRSASGIKDFLLQWCQSRTRGYKVRFLLLSFFPFFLHFRPLFSVCFHQRDEIFKTILLSEPGTRKQNLSSFCFCCCLWRQWLVFKLSAELFSVRLLFILFWESFYFVFSSPQSPRNPLKSEFVRNLTVDSIGIYMRAECANREFQL